MNYLKKIFPLFLFLFSLSVEAQLGEGIYFGKERYERAEIKLENGTSRTGYIKDFTNYERKAMMNGEFYSIERNIGLLTNEFYFRDTENASDEKISIDDIKTLIILDKEGGEEVRRMDKLKVKTINSAYKVVDPKKTMLLPLQSDGKVQIYGFLYSRSSPSASAGGFLAFMPYLKERNAEYAYIPVDINRMNLLNFWRSKKKYIKAIQEVSKKCPKFQAYFKNDPSLFFGTNKEARRLFKERRKKHKKVRKEIENKKMKYALLHKIELEYNLKPYIKLQQKYNELCD